MPSYSSARPFQVVPTALEQTRCDILFTRTVEGQSGNRLRGQNVPTPGRDTTLKTEETCTEHQDLNARSLSACLSNTQIGQKGNLLICGQWPSASCGMAQRMAGFRKRTVMDLIRLA